MRQSQAPIVLPPSLVHLLARRDDAVHKGLYAEAAQVQAELEGLKASTEDALAQVLLRSRTSVVAGCSTRRASGERAAPRSWEVPNTRTPACCAPCRPWRSGTWAS